VGELVSDAMQATQWRYRAILREYLRGSFLRVRRCQGSGRSPADHRVARGSGRRAARLTAKCSAEAA
jgi:hypothetical protein